MNAVLRYTSLACVFVLVYACGEAKKQDKAKPDPYARYIKHNLEQMAKFPHFETRFARFGGVGYADKIEKVRVLYGEPSKVFESSDNMVFWYYMTADSVRILSFQYNKETERIGAIFAGPSIDIFDTTHNRTNDVEAFHALLASKKTQTEESAFIGKTMEEISKIPTKDEPNQNRNNNWSLIYEGLAVTVEFIRMPNTNLCGEIRIFYDYRPSPGDGPRDEMPNK